MTERTTPSAATSQLMTWWTLLLCLAAQSSTTTAFVVTPFSTRSRFSPTTNQDLVRTPSVSTCSPLTSGRTATSSLNLLAQPPPMEEKRKSEDNENSNNNENNDDDDWTPTNGGFLPNMNKLTAGLKKAKHQRRLAKDIIEQVKTLEDYKRVVVDEAETLVVVFWYAPWCRSCKAIAPKVKQLAMQYDGAVKFVKVPVLPDTTTLHQGLGVPSVPFGHIYEPTVGLVEELKMNRKDFVTFKEILKTYVDGECPLPEDEEEEELAFQ